MSSIGPPSPITPLATLRNSVLEFLLTLALLFGVTTIVRWVVGPSPVSSAIPVIRLQLLIVGATVGALVTGLILSPAGRLSGGHVNPAITFTMWRFRAFPGASVVPYIVAQLTGSVLGVLAARSAWGAVIDSPPVSDAAVRPGPGWSSLALFPAEAATLAVIMLFVGWFLSVPTLARFVPGLVGFLVGLAIALLGAITGACANPARQFGPALVSGQWDFLWVYVTAPMVGGFLAAALRSLFARRSPLTHKLCGPRT